MNLEGMPTPPRLPDLPLEALNDPQRVKAALAACEGVPTEQLQRIAAKADAEMRLWALESAATDAAWRARNAKRKAAASIVPPGVGGLEELDEPVDGDAPESGCDLSINPSAEDLG